MSLENRLKEARSNIGYTQRQIAESLGIALRTYSSYEKDASNLSVNLAKKIAGICKISDIWLLTGKGCFNDVNSSNEVQEAGPYSGQTVSILERIEQAHSNVILKFKNKQLALEVNEKLVELESISDEAFKKVANHIDIVVDTARTVSGAGGGASNQDGRKGGERGQKKANGKY